MSPTARTMAELRKRGCTSVWIVEHWNSFAKIRQDLYGFIDVLAQVPFEDGLGVPYCQTWAIQTTSGDHVAERVAKIKDSPHLANCLRANWRIFVWGWRKVGDRGKRKLWALREVEVL